MEDNRTHIIHDRTENRTVGYRIVGSNGNGWLQVVAAEARCNPKDNFCKRQGVSIVENRLKHALENGPDNSRRAFVANVRGPRDPRTSEQWRRIDRAILDTVDNALPLPAAYW